MTTLTQPLHFMREALKEASKAFAAEEVPVGAVVVCNHRIIARAHNQTERLNDATAHAEMLALTSAFNALGSKYLNTCTLYVTLEPCCMCAGAAYWAQLGGLVFGASDLKNGYNLFNKNPLHPKTHVQRGVLAQESEILLKNFFQNIRTQ